MERLGLRWEREEHAHASLVRGEVWVLFHFLFEHRYTGDFEDEHRDRKWANDRDETKGWDCESHEPNPPPLRHLAEIIRVARVGPETRGHELAFVGRIANELRELSVADRFKEKSDRPHRDADDAQHAHEILLRAIDHEYWSDNEIEEKPLQQVHLCVGAQVEPLTPRLAPFEIAIIFCFALVARVDVPGETQSPHCDECCHKECHQLRRVRHEERDPREQHEPKSPRNISYVIALLDEREYEPEVHVHEQHDRERKEVRGHKGGICPIVPHFAR